MNSGVSADRRFRKAHPCPICRGYDTMDRGTGERCMGFLSADDAYAHCSREEHAGSLPMEESQTYAHRLAGDCKCGVRHDPAPAPASNNDHQKSRIIATYDYVDAHGKVRYQVVRYVPKDFRQRRPDGHGGWVWNLTGVQPLPYRLPELIAAVQAGSTILIPEGEKDVLALVKLGLDATTNAMGAKKFPADQAHHLTGAHVVILEDNDTDGRAHTADLYRKLSPVVKTFKRIAFPELPKGGDVSDWLKAGHTKDELLALVAEAGAYKPDALPKKKDTAGNKKPNVIRNSRGHEISCQHNALAWLTKQDIASHITLDTFRQSVLVAGEPISDELIIELVRQMEADTMIHWADVHVRSAVISLAMRNGLSSLTTWLDTLAWDGKARLETFFAHTYHAEYSRYTAACADVLFLSAVARAYQPGCKADVMVVLIGNQGLGKSKGIEELVPVQSWYTDDLGGDLYDRKAAEGLQGKWIIEFGEFARINRATLDVVKAFLSRRVDHYRPAYGRLTKDFPRQCIFVGTTNNPLPLQDLENRRFMPVRCYGYSDDITDKREQLWAEAVARYKAGHPWWITDSTLMPDVKAQQDDARQHDEWEDILREALILTNIVTLTDVAGHVGIKPDRLDKSVQIRLGLVMKAIGFTRKRESTGPRAYFWIRAGSC